MSQVVGPSMGMVEKVIDYTACYEWFSVMLRRRKENLGGKDIIVRTRVAVDEGY